MKDSMNIFLLDKNVNINARYHCDKHVVKMLLETCQMIGTVLRVSFDISDIPGQCKSTHVNHPSVKWITNDPINKFPYLFHLGRSLSSEYTYRYRRIHKCAQTLWDIPSQVLRGTSSNSDWLLTLRAIQLYSEHYIHEYTDFSDFPKVMPEHCIISDDPVECYRNLYCTEKAYMCKWTGRDKPEWFVPRLIEANNDNNSK